MTDPVLDAAARAILEERARVLSREVVPDAVLGRAELLTFSRHGSVYAIGSSERSTTRHATAP